MNEPVEGTNRLAWASLTFSMLTVASFCLGVAPIPMTAWVCYPSAALFGLLSIVSGLFALRQIDSRGQRGRRLALIGIITGGMTILLVLCFTGLTVFLIYYGVDLWKQVK